MELRDRFAAAIDRIRDRPGVWVGHPAPESELNAAEEALGHPLPEELRALLSVANGLSVKFGLRQILPVGREGPMPDLVSFNAWGTWKYAWEDIVDLTDVLVYQLTTGPYVVGYQRAGGHWTDISGVLMAPELLEPPRATLVTMIERGWASMAERVSDPEDRAVLDVHGEIPPGQTVYPGTSYLLEAVLEASETLVLPTEQVFRMCGGLVADGESLPPGSLVVAPFAETDDEGRERWRWITDRDLPGLKPGLLSHITIDGEIPGVS